MAANDIYEEIMQCIADGDEDWARELAQKGLDEGVSPLDLIENGFTPALRAVGDRWDTGSIFLPEMILSADAMKAAVRVLQPALQEAGGGAHDMKTCVVGTVKGDIHDIGKSIVGALVEASGLAVIDLGTNVETELFVNAVRERGSCVIGLSALLTTTMVEMKIVLDELAKAGLRNQVRVAVGGAPVTQAFADEIGADGYAEDGMSAMHLIQELAAGLDPAPGESMSKVA
ncbi:MAG: corrinoid protein [Deltaproteobacteria bacterium]|jgi:corrinoid protein of di/trimethylamine methyltransferase|nr:corrinoid protein [Deltaproteobacteria bacterium]